MLVTLNPFAGDDGILFRQGDAAAAVEAALEVGPAALGGGEDRSVAVDGLDVA
jgi:hypothetical protein